jgi:hypothetical protein
MNAGHAVGGRGTFKEDPPGSTLAKADALSFGVVFVPILTNPAFQIAWFFFGVNSVIHDCSL